MKNEFYKKFTEEAKAKLISNLCLADFDEISQKARRMKTEDTGSFDVIISTDDLDRAGEIVKQDGWDFTNYKNNPIVLWGHDYYSLPIGICTNIQVEGNKTRAQGIFLPAEVNPMAQQVRKLYEFGMKQGKGVGCTTSVGFIPKEFDQNNSSIITRAELLEFSFVPIPANQGVGPAAGRALTMSEAKTLGIDTELASLKGIIIKESQVGDTCQLDDGSPGILVSDPNDPDGPMVCVPQEEDKSAKEDGEDEPNTMQTLKEFKKGIDAEHDRHEEKCGKSIDEFREKCAKTFGKESDEKSKKDFDVEKHLKVLRESLEDEHDMHRQKNVEHFESFEPPKEKKDFDVEKHIKSLHAEHDGYEEKCGKDLDKFDEKMKKSVEGNDGKQDEHTDWITEKMEDHQEKHRDAVHAIAEKMYKSFGEGEESDEKKKGIVEDEFMEGAESREKEERLNYVMTVMYAFCRCYYNAPVTQFFELLQEAIELIESYAEHEKTGESDAEENAEGQAQKQTIVAMVKEIRKTGAKLSGETKEKLGEAHKHIKAAKAVLEALHGGLTDGDGEEKPADGDDKKIARDPANKRSSRASRTPADKDLNDRIALRAAVRGIEAATRDVLAKLNNSLKKGN